MNKTTSEIHLNYQIFVQQSRQYAHVWGLENDDGWVICDSSEFEETEVMPFWSSKKLAKQHSVGEWSGYQPSEINLDEFIDHWLKGMIDDNVMIGPNWNEELEGLEIDPLDMAKKLLDIHD